MTRTQREPITPVQFRAASATLSPAEFRGKAFWLRTLAMFFALGFAAILAATASGQVPKYDVLPVDQRIDENLNTVQRVARTYGTARDLSSFPANEAAGVQRYFSQYVPAKITQLDTPHMINDVMGHARATLESGLRSGTPGSGNVMRWLYLGLKPVAVGNYLPAARINAIQFIARLSRPPAQRGGLPRPYPFVIKDMKEIYDDANNPDGVRAAALKGIERYVRYRGTIDDAAKAELVQSMTQLLESDPPVGRDELAHAFLQRYAVSILTNLSTDASLGKQLVSISTNEDKPDLIALHSAAALARLPGKMAEGDVQTKEVLMQWSKRILNAYEAEHARLSALDKATTQTRQPAAPETFLKETKDPNEKAAVRPGMGMGMGMEMEMMMDDDMYSSGMDMDMMMEDDASMMSMMSMMGMGRAAAEKPQPPEIVASRKKLNFVLQQVLQGVIGNGKPVEDVESIQPQSGLMAATPADSMESTKKWLEAFFDLTTQLNDTTLADRRGYVKSLGEQIESLEALASGKAVEPKAVIQAPIFGLGDAVEPDAADAQPAPAAAELVPGMDATNN